MSKQYINYRLYTDISPYEVIEMSKSGKTAKVRPMKCERINQQEDVVIPGGFCAHTSSPKGQQWSFEPDEEACVRTMSLRKDGLWRFKGCASVGGGCCGQLEGKPFKYYDYNY